MGVSYIEGGGGVVHVGNDVVGGNVGDVDSSVNDGCKVECIIIICLGVYDRHMDISNSRVAFKTENLHKQ